MKRCVAWCGFHPNLIRSSNTLLLTHSIRCTRLAMMYELTTENLHAVHGARGNGSGFTASAIEQEVMCTTIAPILSIRKTMAMKFSPLLFYVAPAPLSSFRRRRSTNVPGRGESDSNIVVRCWLRCGARVFRGRFGQ